MQPLVSVIVPSFNAAEFIELALRSAIGQTYRNLEIIVVDNCSTDGTPDVVRRCARLDDRIRLVENEVNTGRPANSRNRALHLASGKFVAFLDADDVWHRHKIQDQVHAIERFPDLVMVYSILRTFGVMNPLAVEFGLKPLPFKAAVSRNQLEGENTIACSSVLARREILVELGGFDEDPQLTAVEDYDLWLRISARGNIGFVSRVHGLYRHHANALSKSIEMRARSKYLFEKRGIVVRRRDFRRRSNGWRAIRAIGHASAMICLTVLEAVERRLLPNSIRIIRIASARRIADLAVIKSSRQ